MPGPRSTYTPWKPGAGLVPTTLASAAGASGIVPTNLPATYTDGLYTCARLQAPAALIGSQCWFAARIRYGYSSAAIPAAVNLLVDWYTDNNTEIDLQLRSTGVWRMQRVAGGIADNADSSAQTFAAGDAATVVGYSKPSGVGIALNGSAFTTTAGTHVPTVTAATFDIGTETSGGALWIDSPIVWLACGTGTLTDADPATLNALGDTPPYALPWTTAQAPTAIMDATITPPRLWLYT